MGLAAPELKEYSTPLKLSLGLEAVEAGGTTSWTISPPPRPLTRTPSPSTDVQQTIASIPGKRRQHHSLLRHEEDERFDRLMEHMAHENEFACEVSDFLRAHQQMKDYRKYALHKEWEDKVYGNIQEQIDQQLSVMSANEISHRRRALMEDYHRRGRNKARAGSSSTRSTPTLNVTDVHMIKYRFRESHDPLKLELRAKAEFGGQVGPKPKLCRTTLDTTLWNQLECTPYGRYDRMLTNPTPLVGPNGEPYQSSRIPFDHYNIAVGREAILKEMPLGKRTNALQPPSSRIFDFS
ncbi:hypothetical protein AB1Y20_002679 [Prymnesium parvum]|uniref:Clr5 domain-containing protein n=1 Tax=Prymnesium parvum TaxID=97485 RepID=A0AB34J990_PRYPA